MTEEKGLDCLHRFWTCTGYTGHWRFF